MGKVHAWREDIEAHFWEMDVPDRLVWRIRGGLVGEEGTVRGGQKEE